MSLVIRLGKLRLDWTSFSAAARTTIETNFENAVHGANNFAVTQPESINLSNTLYGVAMMGRKFTNLPADTQQRLARVLEMSISRMSATSLADTVHA